MNYCNSVEAIRFQCLSLIRAVAKKQPDLNLNAFDLLKNLHRQIYLSKSLRERIVQVIESDNPLQAAATIVKLVSAKILPGFECWLDGVLSISHDMNLKLVADLFVGGILSQSRMKRLEKSLREILPDVNPQATIPELIVFLAIYQGKVSAIWSLVWAGAVNINAKDIHGRTPLYYAVHRQQPIILETLIDVGANLNVQDYNGMTALHHAIILNNTDCVSRLVSRKMEINLEINSNAGFRAIHFAAMKNSIPIFHLLLRCGASIEAAESDPKRETFLHFVSRRGDALFVEEALEYKKQVDAEHFADYLNAQNSSLHSALQIASSRGHVPVVRKLLEFQVEITPFLLFESAIFDLEEIVRLLVIQKVVLAGCVKTSNLVFTLLLKNVLVSLSSLNTKFYQKKTTPKIEDLDFFGQYAAAVYQKNFGDFAAICTKYEQMYGYIGKNPETDSFFLELRSSFGLKSRS